jgi:hypothetical protein
MDWSKLSAADRRALIAAAVVVVTGITSVIDEWGAGAVLGLLAGIAAVVVLVLPQVSPATKLPTTKGQSLFVLGAVAAIGFALAAVTYLDYVVAITRPYSILFDIGLVAAIALLYFGYMAYQGERGTGPAAS